jgi:hypothetical protein
LVIPDVNFLCRDATKKSGPVINSFVKKIQQQMGVAIVGFAAFRDDTGKLCTFEYVTLSLGLIYLAEI